MKYALIGIASIVLILAFVFGSYYYTKDEATDSRANESVGLFIRDHSPVKGSSEAKITLTEFFDPACETCAVFAPFVKQLMAANPGKIRLVLRYTPFHDGSEYFVKILEAAKNQDMYWEALDAMFKSQPYWASHHNPQPDKIWPFLSQVGLDIDQLKKDMNDPAIETVIEQDMADAKALKVRKTPGFFVNGKPLQQFGYQQLQALIEAEFLIQYAN